MRGLTLSEEWIRDWVMGRWGEQKRGGRGNVVGMKKLLNKNVKSYK